MNRSIAVLLLLSLVPGPALVLAADAPPTALGERSVPHPESYGIHMGAWGPGSFENDDALDWLNELVEGSGLRPVSAALGRTTGEYVEAPDASAAVAAAEIVAALMGRPLAGLPDEAKAWIRAHPARPAPALVEQARAAVRRVQTDSELRELWEEGDAETASAWHACMDDLARRLRG
jgi:Domain of unknown function (DUF4259)